MAPCGGTRRRLSSSSISRNLMMLVHLRLEFKVLEVGL